MKKVIALVLSLVLSLSLVACGGNSSSEPAPAKNAVIVEFVNENKADLIEAMESSFTSSGMTCTSDVKAEGMGFVFTININELDNIDSATKAELQSTFNSMDAIFESSLELMQTELPELEYFEVLVCEKDGDLLATITAGNK